MSETEAEAREQNWARFLAWEDKIALRLLLDTGLRKGELKLQNLRCKDFDTSRRSIHFDA